MIPFKVMDTFFAGPLNIPDLVMLAVSAMFVLAIAIGAGRRSGRLMLLTAPYPVSLVAQAYLHQHALAEGRRPEIDWMFWLGAGLYGIIVPLFLVYLTRPNVLIERPPAETLKRYGKAGWAALLIVAAVCAALKFPFPESMPPGFDIDEATKGILVLERVYGIDDPCMGLVYVEQGYINVEAQLVRWLGPHIWSLKLTTKVACFLCGVLGFWLGRWLYGTWFGFFAGFLLSVSLWLNMISRFAWRETVVPFLTMTVVFFFVRGMRRGRFYDFLIAGAITVVAIDSYPSYRLMPALVFAWLPLAMIFQRKFLWERKFGLLCYFLAFGIAFQSLFGIEIKKTTEGKWSVQGARRFREFYPASNGRLGWNQPDFLQRTQNNLVSLSRTFHYYMSDRDYRRHDKPAFNSHLSVAFTFGVLYALRFFWRWELLLWFPWFGLSMLIAVIDFPPEIRKVNAVLGLLFLLIALYPTAVVRELIAVFPKRGRGIAMVFAAVFVGNVLVQNCFDLLQTLIPDRVEGREYRLAAGLANEHWDQKDVYFFNFRPFIPEFKFLTFPKTGNLTWFDKQRIEDALPARREPIRDVYLIINDGAVFAAADAIVRELYPHAERKTVHPLWTITVPQADIAGSRGLWLHSPGHERRRIEALALRPSSRDAGTEYPREYRLAGGLYIEEEGRYSWKVPERVTLTLDGMPAGEGQLLLAGIHTLEVTARVERPDENLAVSWITPGGLHGPVPPRLLGTWTTHLTSLKAVKTRKAPFRWVEDRRIEMKASNEERMGLWSFVLLPMGRFACTSQGRALILNADGTVYASFGDRGQNGITFQTLPPPALTIQLAADGNLLLTEPTGMRIHRFSLEGRMLGRHLVDSHFPRAVTILPDGSMYSPGSDNRVLKLLPAPVLEGMIRVEKFQNCAGPDGIVSDEKGRIWTLCRGERAVRVWNTAGTQLIEFPIQGYEPDRERPLLAWDPAGYLIVQSWKRMDFYDETGALLVGDNAENPAWMLPPDTLRYPSGIDFTSDGRMAVLDGENGRIVFFRRELVEAP